MSDLPRAERLLGWYDRHARDLPWRVAPDSGGRADPYRIWLSEIMLQQTGVAVVRDYFHRFTERWPDVHALARADEADVLAQWAGLGYYARARNLVKCARVVSGDLGGVFPGEYKALLKLPGIGPYTAAAIAAIAFGQPETVVDGNVERVMARLFCVREPLPAAKPALRAHAARLTPRTRPGDYAQAVMDLGATICTPTRPDCPACPWRSGCRAHALGLQESLPRRAPRAAKPVRHGRVWIARRADGAWLMERRPAKGLLGGMLGWPGGPWGDAPADSPPPIRAEWRALGEQVRHTFTHFHLILSVSIATVPMDATPDHGFFIPAPEFRPTDLPSVMRKAYKLAATAIDSGPAPL